MMWLRRIILILPILLALFFLVAFLAVRVTAPRKLNQFISGSIGEPESLNPILSTTTAAADVEGRVFSGLIRYDENLEVEGDLAKSWEIRQLSRWFFATEAEAETALQRVTAQRPQWAAYRLTTVARRGNALELEFATAGASYREEMTKWLGELKPSPVAFVAISLEADKKFDDGTPVTSEAVRTRLLAALAARPGNPAQRVLYTWTGGSAATLEFPVYGPAEEFVAVANALLKADAAPAKLGAAEADEAQPSLDEPEITFHLRPNVTWHDGEPFTANDVLFTYQMLMSDEVASPRRSDYELVREVTTPDPLTLRVLYKRPYSPALISWSMNVLPQHLLAGKSTPWWAEHFNRQPIGTGPFIFDAWKTNEYIRLRKNPHYWEGAPHLDSTVLRFIPDPLALRLSFETDEMDILGIEPYALGNMRRNPALSVFARPVPMYDYVGWNLKRPIFQDRRVRVALAHAVNVQEIIDYILYGQGVQSTGTFPPQMWFANPNVEPYTYDPERAKQLLAEAGWQTRDAEGWLVKDGQRFEFTLVTNQGNETRKDIATLVQEDLKKLGILVHVEIYEWAVFIKKKIDPQDFDACVLGWSVGYDYDQYQLWHSSQSKPGGLNFCSYRNPKVDKLLVLARSEFDRERAKQYCWELQKTIYEDQPYLFLDVPKGITALHKDVFRVNRPAGGAWKEEPIRETKAGIGVYETWWYRTAFGPRKPELRP